MMFQHGKYKYRSISPPPEGPRKGLNEAFGLPPDDVLREAVIKESRYYYSQGKLLHDTVVGWLGYGWSDDFSVVGRVAVVRAPNGKCRAIFILADDVDVALTAQGERWRSLSIGEFIAAQEYMKDLHVKRAKKNSRLAASDLLGFAPSKEDVAAFRSHRDLVRSQDVYWIAEQPEIFKIKLTGTLSPGRRYAATPALQYALIRLNPGELPPSWIALRLFDVEVLSLTELIGLGDPNE